MIDRFQQRLMCVAFLGALAACGGGGGSSSPPPPPPPSGPAPLAAPPAGALGAILATNAPDLRPLVGGAQWSFHARQYASTGALATLYDSTISQVANDDLTVTESFFQVFLGNGGQIVSSQGGQVDNSFNEAFGTGSPFSVSAIELRSPVQVNDQYVQWQATAVDVGDVDGDGIDDHADILVYATVIGSEPVDLPELGRTVTAVHVDSTTLLLLTLSTTGKALPVQNSVQSTWYASGIGIVRQRATAVSTTGTGPVQYDEVLYAWNGMSAGLGAVGPTAIELPQSLWCCTSVQYVAPPFAATVMANEAMLLGPTNSVSAPASITASVFTSNGQLLRAVELPNMDVFLNGTLFGTGNSTALLVGVGTDSTGHLQVSLQGLDDTPALAGASHTISLPATSSNPVTAWDGQQLWVLWEQTVGTTGNQLMLQPFDANGNPLASAQVLDSTSVGGMGALHLAGTNGAALLTWATETFQGTAYRYATVSSRSATAQVFTLGAGGQGYTGSINSNDAPVPVLGGGVAALLWRGPLFSYTDAGPLPEENPRGVLLDSNEQPVRSATGTLDGETLPATWAPLPGRPLVAAALGGRLVLGGYAYQQQASFTPSIVDMLYTSFLSPGTGPLATAATGATSFEAAGNDWGQSLQSEMPSQILLWPDRALVVGTFSQGTALTQVWLN